MLQAKDAVLVIVDIQGKLATLMHHKDRLFANVVRMVRAARLLEMPILWNEQLPDKLGETAPEIKEALSDSEPMVKGTFSCCDNPAFVERLEATGRKTVLLTGIETHICVYQTAKHLIDRGFDVQLIIDAVDSRLEHNYHLGVKRIDDAGATLTSVEMCLFEMFKEAKGDLFREIVKIVK
ncbi:isochorismatase family protein [candidate division GN15 bacterium]|nr:isochorismatase family protein [candidate division GN15 bacterium]